ncbi:2,3-dihydro-2,3-dihydroxybenzoate dehydrogenase [Chromobacterium sp. IIBBL 290-4]|uniref:2,3-dihydro-2,3-dihydroxybenzoate dehydrogenase n=1 Tax=Chromobacterium sp. IIBBL 290-4 TaxID=2953890 RepID=UPI0020B83439|nr:2,3-dihydro-2,3-dihydroxybenzoate dehydrogenase [Chromobacterium sp. IIBBL 290-4]UTH74253.1 2,3-dihydro-2,3-dihydroxybenzoate dehydrogenase [Chromobacterium sp. IIBBL 290-4]
MLKLDFAGQRVWVTGAAQGIGAAIAAAFAEAGAEVIELDKQFAGDERLDGRRRIALDIADPAQVGELCRRLEVEEALPDVLINAAGVLRQGHADALSLEDWRLCFAVNVDGPFHLLRELLPHFKRRRAGAIVNIASNSAHVPRLGLAAYSASKAAMATMSRIVALELAPYGVRCNLVSPGSTDTPMLRGMWADDSGEARTIAGRPESYWVGIPLGKLARPDDVAASVLFLASPLAGHLTMQDLVVDGGATLGA